MLTFEHDQKYKEHLHFFDVVIWHLFALMFLL